MVRIDIRRLIRRSVAAVALSLPLLALAVATPVLRDQTLLASLESVTLDWRFRVRGPRQPEAPVSIVAIDDKSVRALGAWPIPRTALAEAIDRLSEAGAAAIALDLILTDPARDRREDDALAAALARSGRSVLAVALRFGSGRAGAGTPAATGDRSDGDLDLDAHTVALLRRPAAPRLPEPVDTLAPLAALRRAAAGLGHVNVVLGQGGSLRHLFPVLPVDGLGLPTLAVTAVRVSAGVPLRDVHIIVPDYLRVAGRAVALDERGRWTLNFYGPAGSLPTHSLSDVLSGAVPASALAGRIVWIGANATGVGDAFVTPFDPALPGVEAFATVTANLMEDRFLVRNATTAAAEALGTLFIGGATLAAALLAPAGWAVLLAPLPILAWIALSLFAFDAAQLWLNLTVPVMAGVAVGFAVGAWRFLRSDRRSRRLSGYLPTPLAEALGGADRPAFADRPQPAAVLFADLAGFTSRSETESPDGTAILLRRLHGLLEATAAAHGGYVDSYSGDGGMLVFGVPAPASDDAVRALACARDLLTQSESAALALRVGLHAGTVQVAQLGGRHHRQLSLAGDTVNLASRLMEVAKEHGVRLAVSEPLAAQVRAAGRADLLSGLALRAGQTIRGRRAVVDVWLEAATAR